MTAHILRAQQVPNEEFAEFFRRFKETPGLLHAYDLQGEENPNDTVVVAVWENREAADRYLKSSQLRREVDQAVPSTRRTFYNVLDSK
jgi:heme-degrading monooxygenase HmoA